MTCDYTYSDSKGEVTAVSYDKSTKKLVIEGVDLPELIKKAATA